MSSATDPDPAPGPPTGTGTARVVLLTRLGCTACAAAGRDLDALGVGWTELDVDVAAARSDEGRELRAEHGDRLPVVLLDGREHSWGTVDGSRLRLDLER